MTGQSKALMWTGVGLCAAGALGLVVGAVLDVEAADPWASVAGGVAALIGLALAVYAGFQGSAETPDMSGAGISGPAVNASGTRSVAAGGNIGTASTGDGPGTPAPAPPANPSTPPLTPTPPSSTPPQPRNVTASGERSIAAGGGIGSASTGDT
ncbi:hypothetical protein [Streptomyces sp. NPDC050416]|uniref:hypothetical protein n=1 Tax=Streptomyces sp. NPDC050416 TaxID=3365611 RepID=UPI003796282B